MPTIDLSNQAEPQSADLRDMKKISELEHRVDVLEHKLSDLVYILSTCNYLYETSETIKSKINYE